MNPDEHIALLDHFAKKELVSALSEYERLYKEAVQLRKQLNHLGENEQEMARRLDLLTYQLEEIEKAALEPGEDVRLSEERHRLANSERLFKVLQDSYHSLHGEGHALDFLTNTVAFLEDAASIDQGVADVHETISNCYFLLEEAAFTLRDKAEQVEFDPERLEWIEQRLNEIQELRRKYGQSVEEILEYAASTEEELDTIVHKDERIKGLEQELDSLLLDLQLEAEAVTAVRKKAAKQLTEAIHKELQQLFMENTIFKIQFGARSTGSLKASMDGMTKYFGEAGVDLIEFFLLPPIVANH